MFSKLIALFKVKEDETLNYMNSETFGSKTTQQTYTQKPVRNRYEEDEDDFSTPKRKEDDEEFFRRLEEDDKRFDALTGNPSRLNTKHTSSSIPHYEESERESAMKRMYQCMKERDWNPKTNPRLAIIGGGIIAIGIIMAIVLHETPNPLIGKWQPQKKSNVFVPTGDIEFTKESFNANGNNMSVKYAISDGVVEVIDTNSKMRIPFYVRDDKTIELNILGVKTTYKKMGR